jgi:hypothetical protein
VVDSLVVVVGRLLVAELGAVTAAVMYLHLPH